MGFREIALAGALGLESIIFSACYSVDKKELFDPKIPPPCEFVADSKYIARRHLPEYVDKPIFKKLNHGEFVIPDKVYRLYVKAVMPGDGIFERVLMGHRVLGDDRESFAYMKLSQFLREEGYGEKDIAIFLDIFSTTGNIILSESGLKDGAAEIYLRHERMHREFHNLQIDEKLTLRRAVLDFLEDKYSNGNQIIQDNDGGFTVSLVRSKWTEFYPYLTTGSLTVETLEAFRERYPEAHQIFLGMLDRSAN